MPLACFCRLASQSIRAEGPFPHRLAVGGVTVDELDDQLLVRRLEFGVSGFRKEGFDAPEFGSAMRRPLCVTLRIC